MTIQSDALPHSKRWLDLATGFKYVIVRDPENQFLLSGGLLSEWSQGSSEVFQGNGTAWSPFLTMGKEFGECGEWHFIATGNWRLPNDTAQESTSLFCSMHLGRKLTDKLYALVEMNGIHYTKSGSRLPEVNVEGGDLVNLGAGNVTGNDFISMAAGATERQRATRRCVGGACDRS